MQIVPSWGGCLWFLSLEKWSRFVWMLFCSQFRGIQRYREEEYFYFHYTITITNNGPDTIRLKSRHWEIVDANNQREIVECVPSWSVDFLRGFSPSIFCLLVRLMSRIRSQQRPSSASLTCTSLLLVRFAPLSDVAVSERAFVHVWARAFVSAQHCFRLLECLKDCEAWGSGAVGTQE